MSLLFACLVISFSCGVATVDVGPRVVTPARPCASIEAVESPRTVWDDLADCESGDRLAGAPVKDSARWWYGHPDREHPSWGYELFHGGLQFWPPTWDWVAPMVLDDPPAYAWQATREQQIAVARRTRELQGWEAWPTCARILGLLP